MEIKNRFYVFKEQTSYGFVAGVAYNLETGETLFSDTTCVIFKHSVSDADKIEMSFSLQHSRIVALKWDENNEYLGYDVISQAQLEKVEFTYDVFPEVHYVAFMFDDTEISYNKIVSEFLGYEINPHYKKLEKKYKKESNQVFFRESLDGKITLWIAGYSIIKDASLEDNLFFKVYKNNVLYASASFNKSDCKFDHCKKSVELGLKYDDKYSKILDAYENTYDLIKLAPAITPLTLTKRCVAQIYIQGENVVSNYAGGTYWETEVTEQIDDEDALTNKYYFAKGPKYVEVNLTGFNYAINAAYRGLWNRDCWNAVSVIEAQGIKYKQNCCIKFTKIASADDIFTGSSRDEVDMLRSGQNEDGAATYVVSTPGGGAYYYKYDTYRIEIYTGRDGTGTKIYQSDKVYGKDSNFMLAAGEGLYPMSRIAQPSPYKDPTPNTFNLGDFVIEYQIWGRLLCDVDQSSDGVPMQDLPYDDFATPRRNYRKCIGIVGFDSANSVIKIAQSQETSEKPTAYGMNDFGEYFIAPYTLWQQYYHPLSRSAWANTSMWVELDETAYPLAGYEVWCQRYYKKYTLKNSYHIADVIKALITEIDPTITHEKTYEYSQFLYGHAGASSSALGDCDIYITQKTNILKGEYDQAAQKSEIKLKQLMEMLRDCFRCYWFIDDQNRFRVEHISYFMNGLSYSNPEIQFDLTSKFDKFIKIKALYCQQEVEFDKSDLASRYEFAWMDDTTKSMGGDLTVDIKNKYIQKDKTEEINVDGFTTDIDYMLFLPDNFSNDGFALLMANSNKEVPIVREVVKEEKQDDRWNIIDAQNWYASFNQLLNHYMYDMPGDNVESNNVATPYVNRIKRCMTHEIQFPSNRLSIDINKLITTEVGDGYIEEMSTNIDTDMTKIELRYEPQ